MAPTLNKKIHHSIKHPRHIIYCFLAFFLFCFILWLKKSFGTVSIQQILFHLTCDPEDIKLADKSFFISFLIWCIGIAPLLTLACLYQQSIKTTLSKLIALIHKNRLRQYIFHRLPIVLLVCSCSFAAYRLSLIDYLGTFVKEDYFSKAYVDPIQVKIRPKHLKSLVIIYVESLEQTYANKEIFGKDLLHELNLLKRQGASFEDYEQMQGTGWTIAALVSTQCGIPLNRPIDENSSVKAAHFLASAECLGDILAKNGYQNVFMKGGDLAFSGTASFFQTHHYQSRYGLKEWIGAGINPANINEWGLYDDDLFDQAKIKLNELINTNNLFNLVILTVDTHGANGFLDKKCQKKGYKNFDGIVECSANEVADFVNYIIQKNWLDRLNIIVQGDHLAMKNLVSEKLELEKNRRIFNVFISNQKIIKNTNHITHFDMFPTILTFIGFKIEGGKLALGYNALGPAQTHMPPHRFEDIRKSLLNRSKTYLNLWKIQPPKNIYPS